MIYDVKPGIYHGILHDIYHSGPGVSKSGLDVVRKSLRHYHWQYLSGAATERVATPSMSLGTAVHTAVLEPDTFHDRYRMGPDAAKNSKEWKSAVALFDDEQLLKPSEYREVVAQAHSVRAHPVISRILARGRAESSLYWIDQDTGLLCRVRPDWLCLERGIILDLKTTADARPAEFNRSVLRYRYHVQAAFYLEGVRQTCRQAGVSVPESLTFAIAAVESSEPFEVVAYTFTDEYLALGAQEFRRDLLALARAQETKFWPGYADDICTLAPPAWARVETETHCPF